MRHSQAERLGRLEVDHQLEFRCLLDRQVGRLGAAQDAVDIERALPPMLLPDDPVGNQAALGGETPERIYRRQAVLRGKADNQRVISSGDSARRHDEAAVRLGGKGRDGSLGLSAVVNAGYCRAHPK